MSTSSATPLDVDRARAIWAGYQASHDIQPLAGKTAGIDPVTGRIWFGESAADVWRLIAEEGIDVPVYCVRVGRDYYTRKGGHR